MRLIIVTALLALLPASAFAADCGPLKLLDRIQMIRLGTDDKDLVPVLVNDTPENFLFDTGGAVTQVGRKAANALKLPVHQGMFQLYDATGNISRDEATLDHFQIGHMRGANERLPVSPAITDGTPFDGILAPEVLHTFDVDVDFNSDRLNLFSPDHCDGRVVYWTSPTAAGSAPIFLRGSAIMAKITLDGREVTALVDTGASYSTLRVDDAQSMYNLTLGSADTPEAGNVNGDATLKTYHHVFKTLSFGDVTVNNPDLVIFPNAMGRNNGHEQLVGNRARTEADLIQAPEAMIGMDILRHLHVYFAFNEGKLYVTPVTASLAPAPAPATPPAPN